MVPRKSPSRQKKASGGKKTGRKASPRRTAERKETLLLKTTAAEVGKEIELSLNDEAVSAYDVDVDGKSVTYSSGKAKTPISPGDHTLSWSIVATPVVTVTLSIDAPPEAKWTAANTMPASGRWDGVHDFSVNA
jgi:hypothetical protein